MDISLVLNGTENSLDYLKYCALYFNKITVEEPLFFDGQSFEALNEHKSIHEDYKFCISYFDVDLQSTIHYLQREGICNEDQEFSIFENNPDADQTVFFNPKLFFDKNSFRLEEEVGSTSCWIDNEASIINEEAKEVLLKTVQYLRENNIPNVSNFNKLVIPVDDNLSDAYLIIDIYTRLLKAAVMNIDHNKKILTNSNLVNELLGCYYSKDNKHNHEVIKNFAKLNTARILLPDLCELTIEEILTIRTKASDELGELRLFIDDFLNELPDEILNGITQESINNAIEERITPHIKRFENKLKSLKWDLFSHQLISLGTICGYSELISNHIFSNEMLQRYSPLIGAGTALIEDISYYKSKHNELKNEPLYFTLKLKKLSK